jgi:hypothetical protein
MNRPMIVAIDGSGFILMYASVHYSWRYFSIYLSIHLIIYDSTALCSALATFSVSWSIHSRYDFLDGGSARRKAAIYIEDNTNTE